LGSLLAVELLVSLKEQRLAEAMETKKRFDFSEERSGVRFHLTLKYRKAAGTYGRRRRFNGSICFCHSHTHPNIIVKEGLYGIINVFFIFTNVWFSSTTRLAVVSC
jgi:hypothetical protein